MSRMIRQSYADLFTTHPDAHRKDNEALQNCFTAYTDLGSKALESMVLTFKSVCSFADFEAVSSGVSTETKASENTTDESVQTVDVNPNGKATTINTPNHPLTINVNIQLELPATSEADVYEALFASMAKHIMRLPQTE